MLWRVNPLQQPLHIQGRTMSHQKERQLQRSWRAPLERDTFGNCPAPIPKFMLHASSAKHSGNQGVDGALKTSRNRGIFKEFGRARGIHWYMKAERLQTHTLTCILSCKLQTLPSLTSLTPTLSCRIGMWKVFASLQLWVVWHTRNSPSLPFYLAVSHRCWSAGCPQGPTHGIKGLKAAKNQVIHTTPYCNTDCTISSTGIERMIVCIIFSSVGYCTWCLLWLKSWKDRIPRWDELGPSSKSSQ